MALKIYKTPQLFSLVFRKRLWGFSCLKNEVYLTFDDGPNVEITPWVLDFLRDQNVKATFFCVGDNCLKNSAILERIKREGHGLGGHTMQHQKSNKTSWTAYKKSVDECQNLVQSKLFRPPYGRLSMWRAFRIAREYRIVMWTWLSYDFSSKVTVNEIIKRSAKIKSGDILVLHDNQKTANKIKHLLPLFIEELKKRGFTFEVIPQGN